MAYLGKVTPRLTTFLQAALLCALPIACSTVGDDDGLFKNDPGGVNPDGSTGGSPGLNEGDGDGDGDAGGGGEGNPIPEGWSGNGVTLTGRVMSPTGAFPIAGALVFLTQTDPAPIPRGVYDYECDNMTGTPYALSKADGTWTIEDAPAGTFKIVTRKGNFRRIRDIETVADTEQSVPQDVTTLPAAHSADGRDTIPSFAVVKVTPDVSYNLLGKFGLGDMNGSELILNSARFHMYEDKPPFGGSSLPTTKALFDGAGKLDDYHMIFLPCYADSVGVQYVNSHVQMLRDYVAKGGKIYNSCTASLWSEASFPEYIEFFESDATSRFDIGRRTSGDYTTQGSVNDQGLADWIKIVTNGNDPNNLPFYKGYVTIDNTVDVDNGHGLEEDGGVVKPYTWVTDNGKYPGSPLMVTYDYDAGKVFYSVYETSSDSATITPQEFVLLYVILEVGVCTNLPPDIPPK